MILRIFRGRVLSHRESDFNALVRDQAVADALRAQGLLSVQPALRKVAGGTELLIVSTWTDIEAIVATGRSLDSPVAFPGAAPFLEAGHADHYELVVGGARGMPIVGALVRVLRARIRPNTSSSYFDRVRRIAAPYVDSAAVVALNVGRRIEAGMEEAVSVSVWTDGEALDQASGGDRQQPIGDAEVDEFLVAPPTIEHFDAMTVTSERADAPALLLADDERRYLYATPAAAHLVGRSLSRLLTMRVEDIAPASARVSVPRLWAEFVEHGSMDGPFTVVRPDGSEVPVHFRARAGVPWPGCHTSVLVPVDHAPPDVNEALTAAGVLSRYAGAI